MRKILTLFLLLLGLWMACVLADNGNFPSIEMNVDRPGMNYYNFDLSTPDPYYCRDSCAIDTDCQAYTYVKPGIQGENARCWLKSGVPAAKTDPDCVSGVRDAAGIVRSTRMGLCDSSLMEENTDRPGLDYRNFEPASQNACECKKACDYDAKCKAYTYVEPGIRGEKARCWLKSGVVDPVSKSGCISGVKGEVKGTVILSEPVTVVQYCLDNLPDPVVSYMGTEQYTGSDGNEYIRYLLSVVNDNQYQTDLFRPAPELPPCGKNPDSSRTWINIYDESRNYLYGFCAITSPSELQELWFPVPVGAKAPESVIVEIEDRVCNRVVSASVSTPTLTVIIPDPLSLLTPVLLPAPVQISPNDGEVFNKYPRITEMTWKPVTDAASYTLEVEMEGCIEIGTGKACADPWSSLQVETGITKTSHIIEFVGAQKGRWRVYAIDSNGAEGEKSPWREFTYTV